jgi:hypothetical protein
MMLISPEKLEKIMDYGFEGALKYIKPLVSKANIGNYI